MVSLYCVKDYVQFTNTNWMEAPTSWFSSSYNQTNTNQMEAPTPLFLGTNLKVATTTCLAPPCHPEMQISSCSSSIFGVFTHHCSSACDFYLGPSTVTVLCFITVAVLLVISFLLCHTFGRLSVKCQIHNAEAQVPGTNHLSSNAKLHVPRAKL